MIDTESVYAATFALLQTLKATTPADPAKPFKQVSRRLRHVEDVDVAYMPALYQLQLSRAATVETFQGVAVWSLRAHWYIYVSAPNMDLPSTPILNPMIDLVSGLLPQESGQAAEVEVNGTSVILALDGNIEMFEGLLDTKSIARIPVRIIVPN